jgi:hypothetical protein
MQVRLSKRNERDVNSFLEKSIKLSPGFKAKPTDVVNRILSEGIQNELNRFKINPDWVNASHEIEFKTIGKPINVGPPPKRLEKKKP